MQMSHAASWSPKRPSLFRSPPPASLERRPRARPAGGPVFHATSGSRGGFRSPNPLMRPVAVSKLVSFLMCIGRLGEHDQSRNPSALRAVSSAGPA